MMSDIRDFVELSATAGPSRGTCSSISDPSGSSSVGEALSLPGEPLNATCGNASATDDRNDPSSAEPVLNRTLPSLPSSEEEEPLLSRPLGASVPPGSDATVIASSIAAACTSFMSASRCSILWLSLIALNDFSSASTSLSSAPAACGRVPKSDSESVACTTSHSGSSSIVVVPTARFGYSRSLRTNANHDDDDGRTMPMPMDGDAVRLPVGIGRHAALSERAVPRGVDWAHESAKGTRDMRSGHVPQLPRGPRHPAMPTVQRAHGNHAYPNVQLLERDRCG